MGDKEYYTEKFIADANPGMVGVNVALVEHISYKNKEVKSHLFSAGLSNKV